MQDTSIGNVFHAVKVSQSIETEYNNALNNEGSDLFMSWLEVHTTYSELIQGVKYISQAGFIISSNKKEEIINSLMSFAEIEKEKKILEYALRSMFKANKLSGEYTALIEASVPDEEYEQLMQSYEEIAKKYAYRLRKISPQELVKEAKVVLDAIGEELGSDEIAEILELDVTEVEHVLSEYSLTHQKT